MLWEQCRAVHNLMVTPKCTRQGASTHLHRGLRMRHAEGMPFEDPISPPLGGQTFGKDALQRFGGGLTEAEMRRFQAILRAHCGVEVPLPEAWGRAIELLSLVEMLLQWRGVLDPPAEASSEFALPRS